MKDIFSFVVVVIVVAVLAGAFIAYPMWTLESRINEAFERIGK